MHGKMNVLFTTFNISVNSLLICFWSLINDQVLFYNNNNVSFIDPI